MTRKVLRLVIVTVLALAGSAIAQCGPPTYACFNTTLTTYATPVVPPQVGPNTCSSANVFACGNLTGAGTTITDGTFGALISRATDNTTSVVLSHSVMTVAGSGSGDEMHFNCNDDRLILSDSGGRNIPTTWSFGAAAVPMYVGSGLYPNGLNITDPMFFGHNCGADPYKAFTIGRSSGTALGYYDLTNPAVAPAFTSIADFSSSSHCLGFGSAFPKLLAVNGTISSGTATLTSATAPFNSASVGDAIKVTGAGIAGADLVTTVLSYQSPTQVTLAANASTSVTTGNVLLVSVTWSTNGETDQTDTDFVQGFSNSGGQAGAGAQYVAVYRVGSGCRVLNLSNFTVDGDWGPTGAVTGINGFTSCPGLIHNVKSYKSGGSNGATIIILNGAGCPVGGVVWYYTGLNVGSECVTNCGGHFTEGLTKYANNTGGNPPGGKYWSLRDNTTPSSVTGIVPALPTAGYPNNIDSHCGWNQLDDTAPFFCSTYNGIGNTALTAWASEIVGIVPSGLSNPIRIAKTYNIGVNPSFGTAIAVGSVSQDGKYFAFTSDWQGTLGSTANTATCVPDSGSWLSNTAFSSATRVYVHPGNNNAGGFVFKATVTGTSGSTAPVWPQIVGNTVTDNTITWTNAGVPNCRGDVFVAKMFTGAIIGVPSKLSVFVTP